VVWLEVSGVFFGIFALFAALATWRLRESWRLTEANAATHRSFEGAVAMLAVFGYFCVSSFVRARRRERGR
jgi:multisubunit Na+/H+ antiporter MnhG subunit